MDESRSDEPLVYTESNIRVLEGLEAIRRRPGMYVGSTDRRGLHYLLNEVVELALQEVTPRLVEVRLHRDGSATVRDDGPGFPIEGVPDLEKTMTLTYAGGHSFTGSMLNALSASVEVNVRRGGFLWRQNFSRGLTTSPLERLGPIRETGTAFTFRPDPEIFAQVTFEAGPIAERLGDLAALHHETRFAFLDERTGRSETWECRAGLVDLVLDLNRNRTALHTPIAFKGRCGKTEVSFAFQYHEGPETDLRAFANLERLNESRDPADRPSGLDFPERSRHVVGFLRALGQSLGSLPKPQGKALLGGLTAAIAIRLEDPNFRGATRDTLDNPEAKPIAFSVAFLRLFAHFEEHPEVASRIRNRVIRTASEVDEG